MVSQREIARKARLDVSTVNKILNETPGPAFRPETVKAVKETARELGYKRGRPGKWQLLRALEELVEHCVKYDNETFLKPYRDLIKKAKGQA